MFNQNLKQALKRVHVVVHPFKMLNKSKIEVSHRNRKMIRQKELRVHPNSKISSINPYEVEVKYKSNELPVGKKVKRTKL